jgi:hypothetical protein
VFESLFFTQGAKVREAKVVSKAKLDPCSASSLNRPSMMRADSICTDFGLHGDMPQAMASTFTYSPTPKVSLS